LDKIFVIISPGFPANEADTTCLPFAQSFIKSLNKNFPSLKIIVLSFQYPFFKGMYQWNGNTIISFYDKGKGKIKRFLFWRKVWRQLKKINKENTVVGLFSFWCTECAFIGKYFGWYYHIPHKTWIIGQDAKRDNKYVKLIRPRAENLAAMSDFLVEQFFKSHGIRAKYVVPNGIDLSEFTPYNGQKDIDVLGAGSLIPLKQYNIFIDVVSKLKYQLPGIKAILCGRGPEEENLNQKANDMQLDNNISFQGEIEHAETLKLMQRTKIFLHPSSYEGFSTVCLEALYAGAHVISFCKPMSKEIKNWHIVKNDDEMVKKALELLTDTQTKYERVLVQSMDDSVKAIMKLFGC